MTSDRTAEQWLAMMADPLLASPPGRPALSTARELVIERESYRSRQKPAVTRAEPAPIDEQA